jgi:cell division protein FtsN
MFDGTATGRPYAESEIRKQPVNRDNRQALKQNVTPEMEPIQISIDFAAKTTSTDWIPRQEQADAGWKPVPEPEGTMLQIGSYAAENIAQRAWSDFRLHHTDVVGDYGAQIRKIDLGTRGVWYRVQFGPLSNASATELCERLRAQNVACLVLSR